jgi:urease accessory protein
MQGGELGSFLSVLQLTDSAFPSGRYTLSYGLESYAQTGTLETPRRTAALVALLRDSVRLGVAPSDGTALACAHRAVGADGRLDLELATRADERLTAVKLTREPREASIRTGRALLGTATAAFDTAGLTEYAARVQDGGSPGNHAVILGLLTGWLGVARVEAVAAELYAFSAGFTGAAVRLGLIEHRSAQRLLHRVRWTTAAAALKAVDRDVDDISSRGPLPDVMAMHHEETELRLFAT